MNKSFTLLALAALSFGILNTQAQFGGPGHSSGGPTLGGATGKLFGENQTFSATMEFQTTDASSGKVMAMPGKLSYDNGNSRYEINMSEVKGANLPPNAAAQMKAMGMDSMVSISRPDKKVMYLIYPGMQGYVENPLTGSEDETNKDNFKIVTTELGKETITGHECVKNKVVITDNNGSKHESTVWNAADLKNFPLRIETNEQGAKGVMTFKDVSLTKPGASTFEPPADFTKYPNAQAMMQEVVMKKMGATMGRPPGQ